MKTSPDPKDFGPVDASPVKSFFVSMLTRDIRLEDAILDLLDNCVDGILRSQRRSVGKRPYEGFWANIDFSKDSFSISDNCGGIPWKLHDYAFRMGRSDDRPKEVSGTVGVYGIGMKRAIFKMGKQCLISTQNDEYGYEVEITKRWIEDEADWFMPVKRRNKLQKEDGTEIVVGELHDGISARFGEGRREFQAGLEKMVATHYAFIIDKGFRVTINGTEVAPKPTKLIFTDHPGGKAGPTVRPFIYKTKVHGVEIFMAVGFTRPIPSQDEANAEQEAIKYSSLDAGWTIVCNDRAVVYCDRTELSGWGEARVPRYHNQFIAISGIVEFRADDARNLPTTTTKRGIDASSTLYLQIKNKMREGMLIFTDFTNKWKGHADVAKIHFEKGKTLSLEQLKTESRNLRFVPTPRLPTGGHQYRPVLPMPRAESNVRRIAFSRPLEEVREVSDYLFSEPDRDPSVVGNRCFEIVLREASK